VAIGERREILLQGRCHCRIDVEDDAHEKTAGQGFIELLRFDDVATIGSDAACNIRHQPGAVVARQRESETFAHARPDTYPLQSAFLAKHFHIVKGHVYCPTDRRCCRTTRSTD
jgi:hypothetical protein